MHRPLTFRTEFIWMSLWVLIVVIINMSFMSFTNFLLWNYGEFISYHALSGLSEVTTLKSRCWNTSFHDIDKWEKDDKGLLSDTSNVFFLRQISDISIKFYHCQIWSLFIKSYNGLSIKFHEDLSIGIILCQIWWSSIKFDGYISNVIIFRQIRFLFVRFYHRLSIVIIVFEFFSRLNFRHFCLSIARTKSNNVYFRLCENPNSSRLTNLPFTKMKSAEFLQMHETGLLMQFDSRDVSS